MSEGRYLSNFGPCAISESHEVLARHPVVAAHRPLTCRWPESRRPDGFVVFCHGLGSNGGEYAALSRHLAGNGYLVVHPTFPDSIHAVARAEALFGLGAEFDPTQWTSIPEVKARMHEILHSPAYWLERIEIVAAVMEAMTAIVDATCGRADKPLASAIAGHSFGAFTAQLLAGAEIDLPEFGPRSFRDDRYRAALLLSAQGREQQGLRDGSWDGMTGPVLTVTGTLDQGARGGDWRWKSEPYELAPPRDKYLAVLENADHYLGGFTEGGNQKQVPAQRDALNDISLAFLDAHLRDRPAASAWLRSIQGSVGDCPLLFKSK